MEEDITHMAYDCMVAEYIREAVFKEWWARTMDSTWSTTHSFRREFFFKGNSIIEVAKRTLNDITIYHIWKYRCKVLYEGANAIIPTIIIANNIWLEFISTLWARLNHIKAKANW
jgi:hypothetical protein